MKYHRSISAVLGVMSALWVKAAEPVDFSKDIKPLLEIACVKCHTAERHKGDLRLDTKADAFKGGEKGPDIVAGKPDKSSLYTSTILPPDHDDVMPPKKEAKLTKSQTELLRRWIEQGAAWPDGVTLAAIRNVDFVKDIKPILEVSCVSCHLEGHAKGKLRLDTKAEAFKGGKGGPPIVPGKPGKSSLYTTTALPPGDDDLMPPQKKGGPLSKEEIELLRLWIEQGASWPDDQTLIARKAEAATADEGPIVAEIHKKILANLEVTTEAGMKPYADTISGTQVTFGLVPIPSGEFFMGSPAADPGRKPDEGPPHQVKLDAFWMGKCEVTWNEYELFMYPGDDKPKADAGAPPAVDSVVDAVARPTKPYVEMSFGMGKDSYPAISMTQHAANKYCQWLSAKTGHFYRLPTEAEWEYACRAGTATAYFFGDDAESLGDYAWYGKNSDWKYQKVGKKKPNPWGLYDICGNVAEWCLDQYDPNYYQQFQAVLADNPWNKSTKPYPQVVRGGSWDDEVPAKLRSAARRGSDKSWKMQDPQLPKSIWYHTDASFLGFRVVRPLKVPPPEDLSKYWTSGLEKE